MRSHDRVSFSRGPESDVGYLLREWVARREIGIGASFLWHDELVARFQVDRPAAILSSAALEIDPWQFTKQLWMRSLQRGVRMYERTAIAAEHWSHFPSSVRTANGFHVTCENVVLATGYEAPEQFPALRSLCSLKSTFALATEPVDEERLWPGRALIWEMGDPYLYLRTTADNRVLIGGEDVPFTGTLPDDTAIDDAARSLLAKLGVLFPQLADVAAEYAWTGVFASTSDGLPYIGTPRGIERCHFALGYGGNGITFSLIAARIICDQICGRPENPLGEVVCVQPRAGLNALIYLRVMRAIATGGASACASACWAWILRTMSIPFVTRPNAANPWPSALRLPPKSSSGWAPMQMKKSDVALSGPPRAMESVPSR